MIRITRWVETGLADGDSHTNKWKMFHIIISSIKLKDAVLTDEAYLIRRYLENVSSLPKRQAYLPSIENAPNYQFEDGKTLLHQAAGYGREECLWTLIENGWDPKKCTPEGKSVIDFGWMTLSTKTISRLLQLDVPFLPDPDLNSFVHQEVVIRSLPTLTFFHYKYCCNVRTVHRLVVILTLKKRKLPYLPIDLLKKIKNMLI